MAQRVQQLWRKGFAAWLATFTLAALVIGCGGGGTDTASGGVGVGGTGAAGPVTGFGSIIVNDIHFEFGQSTFTTEDESDGGDQSDEDRPSVLVDRPVGLGTVVSIQAGKVRQESSEDHADASVITVISAIKGPISAKGSNSLTILGQTVDVDASTQYVTDHEWANLQVNDNVVVYGNFEPVSGHYKATRIDYRLIPLKFYKVRGYLTDFSANTVTLNGSLTLALRNGLRSNDFQRGQLVRVRMERSFPNIAIVAVPVGARLVNNTQAHEDGVITRVSGSTVDLDGVTIDLSHVSLPQGGIRVGSRLEVVGTVSNGVLVASQLTSGDDRPNFASTVKLRGRISTLGATQFTVSSTIFQNNQVVTVSTTVQYTANVIDDQATLHIGTNVEVEGTPSGPDQLVATRIRLR